VADGGDKALGVLEAKLSELLRSQDLLGMALDQLPVVLFATDADGIIRIARGKGAVRLGPNAVGRSAFELFADAPRVIDNLRRALAGEAITTEGENDRVWWETRYMPMRGPSGEVAGVVGVTMDATARKRAEEELRKAKDLLAREVQNTSMDLGALAAELVEQRRNLRYALDSARAAREEAERAGGAKSAFLAMLAQQVQAPLATIAQHAELLSARGDLPSDGTASAKAVATASARLTEILETLLGYADMHGGGLSVRPELVDLARLARGVVADFAGRAKTKGLTLQLAADESLPAARTDPRLMRILLASVVGEAVASGSTGTIGVSVSCEPGGHVVRVSRAAGEQAPGLGLGVVIVDHVADALGAHVRSDDGGQPGRDVVCVTLPPYPLDPAARLAGE
jgi:signal transduction histidine kinase